jgi:hypothetical protein
MQVDRLFLGEARARCGVSAAIYLPIRHAHSPFFMLHCCDTFATWSRSIKNLTSLGLASVVSCRTHYSACSVTQLTGIEARVEHPVYDDIRIPPDRGLHISTHPIPSNSSPPALTVKCA